MNQNQRKFISDKLGTLGNIGVGAMIFGQFLSDRTFDKLVKSQKWPLFVIPANAVIQENQSLMDSRVRGSDNLGDFLRDHQHLVYLHSHLALFAGLVAILPDI